MENSYRALKDRHQNEFNEFPMAFAFSDKQFEEGMAKLGLKPSETDKVFSMGGGGFSRKTDAPAFQEMNERHAMEMVEAILADESGEGFVYDMFSYELANHEYGYTQDVDDTLRACGFTEEQVNADPKLLHALTKARQNCSETSF